MKQKTSKEIKIDERNPNVLNDYLKAVRDGYKERINNSSKALSDYIIGKVGDAIKDLYKNDKFLLHLVNKDIREKNLKEQKK